MYTCFINMVIYIAHRGNLTGPNPEKENLPEYIVEAIDKGCHVEVDVWCIKNELYLGHDAPQYKIDECFLLQRHKVLWIHCKNLEALDYLLKYRNLNVFVHDKDMATLTSHNYVWTYPGCKYYPKNSICVMPEWEVSDITHTEPQNYIGVCSDHVESIKCSSK
jgi:hypothetical protein